MVLEVLALLPQISSPTTPDPDPAVARAPRLAIYRVQATTTREGTDGTIPLAVSLRVDDPPRPRMVLQIPRWTPGSYRLRDFPERLTVIGARDRKGTELAVERLGPCTWQIRTAAATAVVVDYAVALRPSDRFMMPSPDRRCLTYEGPAVYLYVRGRLRMPARVEFELPDGWSVATGLMPLPDGSFFAEDYDFLADCPVKLGRMRRFEFTSHATSFDVVVDGPEDLEFDERAWLDGIRRIADVEGAIFGGFPVARYTFLYTVSPLGGGGGLEHLTSSAIGLSARSLQTDPRAGMSVTAHELFHLWNVKRIRPFALGPFDYQRPNRTTMLWLMEGVTSYYADLILVRAGLQPADRLWSVLAGHISRLESAPARREVSSAEASWTVWDARPAGQRLNYYNSGEVLGFLLDVETRARTANRRSLDDLMRVLLAFCRDQGRGFHDHELVMLAGMVAGADLREWFDRYVYGTVSPPYADLLERAGLRYTERVDRRKRLHGVIRSGRRPYFVDSDARGVSLPARSGVVVAANGTPVEDPHDLEKVVERLEPGAPVRLTLRTPSGRRIVVRSAVRSSRRVSARIEPDPAASDTARAIREGIAIGK